MQDLSMQFSEIIVNSLNADSSLITILIEDSETKDKIIFEVIDNGRGMTKEFLEKLTDPFQSTRKVRKIGLGTAFFKEMCDQCEGEFKVESKVGKGSTVSTYVRKTNIDVPPMGDIPGMMMAMLTNTKDVNIDFTYKSDVGTFHLNTKEIQNILGDDVKITDPNILVWIKEYMSEGITKIKGGSL
jgi:hypothetical protein